MMRPETKAGQANRSRVNSPIRAPKGTLFSPEIDYGLHASAPDNPVIAGSAVRRMGPPALFWVALAFTLTMAWLPHPPAVPGDPSDKVQHIAAFVCLSFLGIWAFPQFPLQHLGERLSFVGAIIEVVQNIPVLHRDCDIRDWIADTLAVTVVLLAVATLRRLRFA